MAAHVAEAVRLDGDVHEGSGALPTNVQKNTEIDELEMFHAQKTLADVNARFMCGFKTAESHIEDLLEPTHGKHFTVLSEQENQARLHRI